VAYPKKGGEGCIKTGRTAGQERKEGKIFAHGTTIAGGRPPNRGNKKSWGEERQLRTRVSNITPAVKEIRESRWEPDG